MTKRSRGVSIAEVLVATSAFMVVMMIGVGALHVVKRASDQLRGRSQPRQQLRALLGHLQRDLRAATFIFDPHGTLSFSGGYSHPFHGSPPSDPQAPAAPDAIWALAESASSEPTYEVETIFLQPDANADRAFIGSHRVVLASVSGLSGTTPGSPADISLSGFPASHTQVRTFATASPGDGLRVRRNASKDGLFLEFVIGHRNQGEKVMLETYQTQLTMRNNR